MVETASSILARSTKQGLKKEEKTTAEELNSQENKQTQKSEISEQQEKQSEEFFKGLSKSEHKKIRSIMHHVFKKKYSYTSYNVPADDRTFTLEQTKQFLEAVEHPVYKLLFKTQLVTGMRIGEVCNLKIKDILWRESCFLVAPEKKGYTAFVKKDFPASYGKELVLPCFV